jgi:cullin-4
VSREFKLTEVADVDLNRTLQSLACAKLRPLRKTPQGRDINDSDTFSMNKSFSHKKYRIKINQVQLKETKEENKETHERVMADREFETQAAIVRIMKSKKTISHTLLVTEVIDATKKRGVLSGPEIKKQIERFVTVTVVLFDADLKRLIEKDYMERQEGTTNMYNYVA